MSYNREINNRTMIQYIILYTLAEANRHVTFKQLSSLILDNLNIEFTDFRISLSNLEETEHIRSFAIDELTMVYELLPKGAEANEFFKKNIPIYIREPISEAISPFFNEEEKKQSIRTELIPLNHTEFAAKCGIYDRNTPLLELTVYAGSRNAANDIMKRFSENTDSIYEQIIEIMMKSDK